MNSQQIEKASIEGKEVSIDEAFKAVCDALKKESSLLWRGSNNKSVTDLFMQKLDGYLTKGSFCSAGEAGIVMGRGVHKPLPIEQINDADTVVIWGSNVAADLHCFQGKDVVVIDPIKTSLAKKADYHLQIQPRTDFYIAILLARFIYMNDEQNDEWLDEFASSHEDFYDFTMEYRIKPILEYCGVDLANMGEVLSYIQHKKVVFLIGSGVQKYTTGSYVLRAIDSLAAILGLFGKVGCGVHFLSSRSQYDIDCKRVSKITTNFSEFDTVLVQDGNPAESMPNSKRVCEELDKVENLIYIGKYKNETSLKAKIVIPSNQISEYDFTKRLFDAFNFDGLESEKYYQKQVEKLEYLPYKNGFGEEGDDEFEFIEEYEDDFIKIRRLTVASKSKKKIDNDERFWLISTKSAELNKVQVHPNLGYVTGDKINIISQMGELELEVVLSENIRENCLVVSSGTKGLNTLTPALVSEYGESACFNELKVAIERSN